MHGINIYIFGVCSGITFKVFKERYNTDCVNIFLYRHAPSKIENVPCTYNTSYIVVTHTGCIYVSNVCSMEGITVTSCIEQSVKKLFFVFLIFEFACVIYVIQHTER